MLRSTLTSRKAGDLKSAIIRTNGSHLNGYAKVRSRGMVMSENKGWSSGSIATIPLQRLFKMKDTGTMRENLGGMNESLNQNAKTLSPHWRPFALADGGVLFLHPSQKQVMQWSSAVTEAESQATGLSARDHQTASKMRQLVEDNTIEHTPLSEWRRKHMFALIERQTGLGLNTGDTSHSAAAGQTKRTRWEMENDPELRRTFSESTPFKKSKWDWDSQTYPAGS